MKKSEFTDNAIMFNSINMKNNMHAKFNIERNMPITTPFENRMLYVNCSNTTIHYT